MSIHCNSKLNDNPHHLYEVFDKGEDIVFRSIYAQAVLLEYVSIENSGTYSNSLPVFKV